MRSWKFRQSYREGVVSVPVWCGECQAETPHKVEGHKLTNICIPCQARPQAKTVAAPRQGDLNLDTFMDWETGRVRA